MARRKKKDLRNTVIAILLVIVAVQSYILWIKPHTNQLVHFKTQYLSQSPVEQTKPVVTSPVVQKPVQSQSIPEDISPVIRRTGTIAIVLDDWGYNTTNCDALQHFPAPVTVAILPNLRFTSDIARCAQSGSHQIILHLPLEPQKPQGAYPPDYVLTTTMPKAKVETLIEQTLQQMPYLSGVNNHMGSKATEDYELMNTLFTILKRRGLFFLDSRSSSNSVAEKAARDVGLPFASRDVFLDNYNKKGYIRNQLHDAVDLAAEHGFVLMIGHDRPMTIEVLQEEIPALEAEGFRFVTVSDYIRLKQEQ